MLRHWICLCACSNVEASIWYILISRPPSAFPCLTVFCFSVSTLCHSLHVIFALRFLLGCLSGKAHHVHYQLVFFAQRSFKSLPREWAHPTKEKPCKLNDADHIWLYLIISDYIWWHDISRYQSAICENPFNRLAKLQSPPMRHARSLAGDTFSLTPRRVRPSESWCMAAFRNRNRLHMLHNPCSWLQRMEWHRNCADLRLKWTDPYSLKHETFHCWQSWHELGVAVSHSSGRTCLHSSLGHMQASWIHRD